MNSKTPLTRIFRILQYAVICATYTSCLGGGIAMTAISGASGTGEPPSSSANIPDGLPAEASQYDIQTEPDAGETELGTIVGSPNTGKASLLLKTISEDPDAASDPLTASANCDSLKPEKLHPSGSQPQRCRISPSRYRFGISGIYLVRCVNAGEDVACAAAQDFTVAERVPVYLGPVMALDIDDVGTAIDIGLAGLETSGSFGGIQIVTSYVGHVFPNDESVNAERIIPSLRGAAFRFCAAAETSSSPEEMTALCGFPDARRGDFLIDVNDDGIYGFIDTATLSPSDNVAETDSRPADYETFVLQGLAQENYHFTNAAEEYTDGETFGATAGDFAPILAFDAVTEIDPASNLDFAATIDIRGTLSFTDGKGTRTENWIGAGAGFYDEAIFSRYRRDTLGIYDPYDDGLFRMLSPTTNVNVSDADSE